VCFQRCQAPGVRGQDVDLSARVSASHKKYKCSVCVRHFASIDGLRLHEDLHRGRYRYHCVYCGKGFSGTTNLKGHMAKHTGVNEYKCSYCTREFSYASSWKYHVRSCPLKPSYGAVSTVQKYSNMWVELPILSLLSVSLDTWFSNKKLHVK